jgi:hypothetical protein
VVQTVREKETATLANLFNGYEKLQWMKLIQTYHLEVSSVEHNEKSLF